MTDPSDITARFKDIPVDSTEPVMDIQTGKMFNSWELEHVHSFNVKRAMYHGNLASTADLLDPSKHLEILERTKRTAKRYTSKKDSAYYTSVRLAMSTNHDFISKRCEQGQGGNIVAALQAQCSDSDTKTALQQILDYPPKTANDCLKSLDNIDEFKGRHQASHLGQMLYAIAPQEYRLRFNETVVKFTETQDNRPLVAALASLDEQGNIAVYSSQLPVWRKIAIEQTQVNIASAAQKLNGILLSQGHKKDQQNSYFHARAMPQSQARYRFDAILHHIETLPNDPQSRNARDFLLAGLESTVPIVFTDAMNLGSNDGGITATYGHYVNFKPASDFNTPRCIELATRHVDTKTATILLEEAGHSRMHRLYANRAEPFLYVNDARYQLLHEAMRKDMVGQGHSLYLLESDYERHKHMKEVPVKILVKMAEGKWSGAEKLHFPHLHEYVTEVLLKDHEYFTKYGHVPEQPAIEKLNAKHHVLSRIPHARDLYASLDTAVNERINAFPPVQALLAINQALSKHMAPFQEKLKERLEPLQRSFDRAVPKIAATGMLFAVTQTPIRDGTLGDALRGEATIDSSVPTSAVSKPLERVHKNAGRAK